MTTPSYVDDPCNSTVIATLEDSNGGDKDGKPRRAVQRIPPATIPVSAPLPTTIVTTRPTHRNGNGGLPGGTLTTTGNTSVGSSPLTQQYAYAPPPPILTFHDSASLLTANTEGFSLANSEPFSSQDFYNSGHMVEVMSLSEASSIIERHIASRPIDTEEDFHYIAELLRTYESEDDLKRIAELIRAKQKGVPIRYNDSKDKKAKKSSGHKKRKKKDKKKHKEEYKNKVKEPTYPIDEDEDPFNDSAISNTRTVTCASPSASSMSVSSESTSSRSSSLSSIYHRSPVDDVARSARSSSVSSSDKKPKKRIKFSKKEKKLSKKDKKSKDKESRKKPYDWAKKAKKASKRERTEGPDEQPQQRESNNLQILTKPSEETETVPADSVQMVDKDHPPRSIQVIKGKEAFENEHEPVLSNTSKGSSKSSEGGFEAFENEHEPTSKGGSTKSDGALEAFENEPEESAHPASPPSTSKEIRKSGGSSRKSGGSSESSSGGSRELFFNEMEESERTNPALGSFPYPGMIQRNNSEDVKPLIHSSRDIAVEGQARGFGTTHRDGSDSSEPGEPAVLFSAGVMQSSKLSVSEAIEESEVEFDDSFAPSQSQSHSDSFRDEEAPGVPFPPSTAEDEELQPTSALGRAISSDSSTLYKASPVDSLPVQHRKDSTGNESLKLSTLGNSSQRVSSKNSVEKSSNSDVFNDSWAEPQDATTTYTTEKTRVGRSNAPTLPTIYASASSGTDQKVGSRAIDISSIQEFEEGLAEQSDDSASESTPDDEQVKVALKQFNPAKETAVERDKSLVKSSTAYPPLGNFQFARQTSAGNASSEQSLPASKLNASLLVNRKSSSGLLKTTLDMSRQRSGTSLTPLTPSALRPPSNKRLDSGIISTQDIDVNLPRESMARVASSDMLQLGSVHEERSYEPNLARQLPLPDQEQAGEVIQAEFAVKPRLLCLHGWRSNAEITRLQLDNLGLLDFFDPIFIEGPHTSSKPADHAVNLLSQGPYYSWVEKSNPYNDTDDAVDSWLSLRGKQESMRAQRHSVYAFGRTGGPGGRRNRERQTATEELMLSLKAVMVHLLTESQYLDAFVNENEDIADIPCYDAVYGFSQGATLVTLLSYEFVRNRVLEELNLPPMRRLPWRFVFSACAANTNMKELLAQHFELEYSVQIPLPSVHIIGLSDSRKGQSEAIMKEHYNSQQAFPVYLDSGHGIPAATRRLTHVLDEILNWFLLKVALPDVDVSNVPLEAESQHVSLLHVVDEIDKIQRDELEEFSSIDAELDVGQLHLGAFGQYIINTAQPSHSNLVEMLEDANPSRLAFLAPEAKPLTYGAMLKFIRGDGDLRRAGAGEGFTVAYVAPFGVVSAAAFVTIAAQCTAAPLDPGYNESDYVLAFDQINPDLVITFDGVDSGVVHKVALGKGLRVVHATVIPGTCGLFKFEKDKNPSMPDPKSFLYDTKHLVNRADNNGLILRTSGTTSKPKVVPLKLWAIITNSRVIAKSLGLRSSDIALNAMPLFHIGGLSANLLSSLAAGGSVILLPKFSAPQFFDFLTSPEEPRPTWYSAVPTMHAAIHLFSEDSIFKTSLRFIRSGAAAMPHDLAIKMEQTFECPLILTYSMTEQMPITQPPCEYSIPRNNPNSVGQPVCVSMCIVDENLRPVPFVGSNSEGDGEDPVNGEVCISGPMVVEGYHANASGNANSFFRMGGMDWFRTGDMGHLDKGGFLFLTGRSKELIKRGGDQVSPYEVEDAIYKHRGVKTAVVFAIPDPIWGERVGAAVVLKDGIKHEQLQLKKEMNKMLLDDGLQPFKLPDQVVIVTEADLPKTRSNKYIRIGLARALGVNSNIARDELKAMRPVNYHEAAVGVKFFLALAVIYVHVGNFDKREYSDYAHDSGFEYGWERTRSWCWHNPIFFLVGGFLLAAGTHVPVTTFRDLRQFYSLRIAGLHPMYLISICFCTINFIARCRPSNFIPEFNRLREPLEGEYFVCQAAPIEWSYWPTLIISIISYACTLQSWPLLIPFSWFLSYYTWFSSVYIFCIFAFPWCHQQFHAVRDDPKAVWRLTMFWLGMNYVYAAGLSVLFGMNDDAAQNYFALSSYLFPPGWFPCCACGVGCFYLFRLYRPNERAKAWVWGTITDIISLLLFAGWLFYGLAPAEATPAFAEDDALVARHWFPFLSRILAPFGFLWFWGLAVGTGYTSKLFSIPIVVEWLAPASYNMFLFHQPVSEWYFLATRGEWWAYPKTFFWFSPYPYPVAFWEFFIVAAIVVALSVVMEAYVNELLVANFSAALDWMTGSDGLRISSKDGESVLSVVQSIIRELTYAEVTAQTGLTEAGLSSMTTIILVSEIKKVYKTLKLTVRDVINSDTVGELVDVIEGRMKESASRPELALGKRTGVVAPKALKKMMEESMEFAEAEGEGPTPAPTLSRQTSFALNRGTSSRFGSGGSTLDSSQGFVRRTDGRFGSVTSRRNSRSRRASHVLNDLETSGSHHGVRRSVTAAGAPGRNTTRLSFSIQTQETPNSGPSRRRASNNRLSHSSMNTRSTGHQPTGAMSASTRRGGGTRLRRLSSARLVTP
ncbi:7a-methyl-1,5-dioxo-octahydro-1H-inden-4-yl [Seminavis robusta]|uniref:7a-methyl-1,5-dioxo-octahydro-1H-inden-4-yl n=1 Tax=Seminavis robusta TaxID=568900 RepID=A0A9N8DZB5_9STRA|nr:7a-methyl-1,5-dioxo-octahydro-1H-inden-4-yl [Seminavis robusta]|eukprot:Sro466_g148760.1 7a-methyl-1,5-dioxo-octahydro-1H-inden-4-yl (2555) ;mRNA; f:11481-20112